MTRAILLVLLAVASSSAKAEWVSLSQNDVFTAYANPDTIRRSGDMVEMATMIDYSAPLKVEAGRPFKSIMVRKEYDCKNKQYQQLSLVAFSDRMGAGQTIYSDSSFRQLSRVVPDTMEEKFFNYACGKK
jgi:hypothetical protein